MILLLDDESVLLELYRQLLATREVTVSAFTDPAAALPGLAPAVQ